MNRFSVLLGGISRTNILPVLFHSVHSQQQFADAFLHISASAATVSDTHTDVTHHLILHSAFTFTCLLAQPCS